jgi:hypothetical protein
VIDARAVLAEAAGEHAEDWWLGADEGDEISMNATGS